MAEETKMMLARRPLRNFVFYPAIQWPQILRNSLLVASTALGTGLAILLLYSWEYGNTSLYVLNQDAAYAPLEEHSVLMLIAPAVIGTALMALLLGWLLALSASRRIALPIYKVIQWSKKIAEGNLAARLTFRDHDHLDELSQSCNGAIETTRSGYLEFREILHTETVPEPLRSRLVEVLSRYQF